MPYSQYQVHPATLDVLFIGSQGEIQVASALDREETDRYTLTIEARDNNDAPDDEQRVTKGVMNVYITDVNDSPPVWVLYPESFWKKSMIIYKLFLHEPTLSHHAS